MTKPQYVFSLKIGDSVFDSTGETATEALGSLPRPPKIMAKGILTVAHGKLKNTILLSPPQIKRLFYNSTGVQAVHAKRLVMGLK